MKRTTRVLAAYVGVGIMVAAAAVFVLRPKPPPNVIIISMDTLRSDHISVNGYGRNTTPRLDQLAAEGATFTNAYSMAPSTDPSHATMFTGRYLSEHGKYSHRQKLGDEELTLAELFLAQGYRTSAFTTSMKFIKASGFSQGFQTYTIEKGPKNERTEKAIDKLLDEMKNDEQPIFSFLHLFDPHAPYAAPKPYRNKWHESPKAKKKVLIKPKDTSKFIRRHQRKSRPVPKAKKEYLKSLYDGQLTYMDDQLDRLFQAVEDKGNTMIVITSDHGEAFFEHGYVGHSNYVYEEIMRVPFVVWWPGEVDAGIVSEEWVQGVDLFPTVAEMVGLPMPPNISGRSMANILWQKGEVEDTKGLVIMQSPKEWGIAMNTPEGRFKLSILLAERKERLMRLDTDPGAHKNVLSDHPMVRDALYSRLAAFNMEDPRGRTLEVEHSDEELEELKALGYVD